MHRAETPRIAFVGDAGTRSRVAAMLAPQRLFEPLSDADVIVAELSGTAAEQRRRGRTLIETLPDALVVFLTRSAGEVDLQRLLETGARAIVLHDRVETALTHTLLAVWNGQICAPAETRGRLAPRTLTRREKEVMTLVAMGLPNAEIGRRLHVGETTVKSHVATSLRKLGVRSRTEAAELVLDPDERAGAGIVSLSPPPWP